MNFAVYIPPYLSISFAAFIIHSSIISVIIVRVFINHCNVFFIYIIGEGGGGILCRFILSSFGIVSVFVSTKTTRAIINNKVALIDSILLVCSCSYIYLCMTNHNIHNTYIIILRFIR